MLKSGSNRLMAVLDGEHPELWNQLPQTPILRVRLLMDLRMQIQHLFTIGNECDIKQKGFTYRRPSFWLAFWQGAAGVTDNVYRGK